MSGSTERILKVRDLGVTFHTSDGDVRAVDGIDLNVDRGQIVGLVGESGSGKSVCTRALIKLLPSTAKIDSGTVMELTTGGGVVDIAQIGRRDRRMNQIRGGEIAMIFQEPMSSLAPTYRVGNPIVEAARLHRDLTKQEARHVALDLLERVGISEPSRRIDQYPFELSGGMRQRVMIAVALASQPRLLIADEPTTALDVTIQAQILDLLRELRDEFEMSIIFITHDLGVISQIADDVAVMYLGKIVETGTVHDIITDPEHPYTSKLLDAIPRLDRLNERLSAIPGDIPSPLARPPGCPFHTRCEQAIAGRCEVTMPDPIAVSASHLVSCHLHDKEAEAASATAN